MQCPTAGTVPTMVSLCHHCKCASSISTFSRFKPISYQKQQLLPQMRSSRGFANMFCCLSFWTRTLNLHPFSTCSSQTGLQQRLPCTTHAALAVRSALPPSEIPACLPAWSQPTSLSQKSWEQLQSLDCLCSLSHHLAR